MSRARHRGSDLRIAIWRSLPQRSRPRGFTLIEVMIALVVFAVVGFAVSARVGDVVNQTYSLERRTVAHWVAMNQLTRMRMLAERQDAALPTGRSRERVTMGGRDWLIEIEVADTTHPLLRRVELSVSVVEEGDEIGPIDHLSGFLGRY